VPGSRLIFCEAAGLSGNPQPDTLFNPTILYRGMIWTCKTATRSGNQKRQPEAATRRGKKDGSEEQGAGSSKNNSSWFYRCATNSDW